MVVDFRVEQDSIPTIARPRPVPRDTARQTRPTPTTNARPHTSFYDRNARSNSVCHLRHQPLLPVHQTDTPHGSHRRPSELSRRAPSLCLSFLPSFLPSCPFGALLFPRLQSCVALLLLSISSSSPPVPGGSEQMMRSSGAVPGRPCLKRSLNVWIDGVNRRLRSSCLPPLSSSSAPLVSFYRSLDREESCSAWRPHLLAFRCGFFCFVTSPSRPSLYVVSSDDSGIGRSVDLAPCVWRV